LVAVHELFDVILQLNMGMGHRPKMRSSDKCEKRQDVLAAFAAEGMSQCFLGALRGYRIHKDQSANCKLSDLRFRYQETQQHPASVPATGTLSLPFLV
jgi:hypothetical protein